MKPDDFWELAYSEFMVILEEYNKETIRERNKLVFTAWHVAMFERQKRLPALDSVLMKETETHEHKKQTPDEMMAVCKMLNAAFGGEEIIT